MAIPLRNSNDIGGLVRDQRLAAGLTLPQLAERADVSRRWLATLEAGSPGASIAKVMRTLDVLEIAIAAEITLPNSTRPPSSSTLSPATSLDEILRAHTEQP